MKKIREKLIKLPLETKASVAYTICNIIQKGLAIITLPIFTRLMTTEQYGQSSIYSSWFSILVIFTTLNLQAGSFNTAMIEFGEDREGYIVSVQWFITFLNIALLAIYLPLRSYINSFLELPTYLVLIMFLEAIMSFSCQCWYGKNRFENKYVSTVIVTLLISIIGIISAVVLVVLMQEKGYAKIIGISGATIIIGLGIYLLNLFKAKKFITIKHLKFALSFNLPLIIYYVSQVIFNQVDRLMINYFCGTDKAGIYSVAYGLAMILLFIVNAISGAYVPWLYRKIKEKRPLENQKISCYIAILMAILISLIIWLAPEIILIMAGENYLEAVWVVPPVAASLLLLLYTDFSNHVEFYYKKRLGLIITSILSALLNIVLNFIFIGKLKLSFVAAGYTTFASYLVFAITNYLVIRKFLKKGADLHGLYNVKYLVLIFFAFIVINSLAMLLYNYMFVRIGIIAISIILLIVFRKKIFAIIKTLKGKENDSEPPSDSNDLKNDNVTSEDQSEIDKEEE